MTAELPLERAQDHIDNIIEILEDDSKSADTTETKSSEDNSNIDTKADVADEDVHELEQEVFHNPSRSEPYHVRQAKADMRAMEENDEPELTAELKDLDAPEWALLLAERIEDIEATVQDEEPAKISEVFGP